MFSNSLACECADAKLPDWIILRNIACELGPVLNHFGHLFLAKRKICGGKIRGEVWQVGEVCQTLERIAAEQSLGSISRIKLRPARDGQPQQSAEEEQKYSNGDYRQRPNACAG